MADFQDKKLSRRSVLKGAAMLAGAAAGSTLLVGNEALAAKAPKAAMQYQDHPKGGNDCSKCMQFIPGGSPKADGTCKVVAGSISPRGYCLAFTPKS
ncbi:MAG: twin-arginine translocation signal domain-containing protein [Gammaproteobacteria bacterium]